MQELQARTQFLTPMNCGLARKPKQRKRKWPNKKTGNILERRLQDAEAKSAIKKMKLSIKDCTQTLRRLNADIRKRTAVLTDMTWAPGLCYCKRKLNIKSAPMVACDGVLKDKSNAHLCPGAGWFHCQCVGLTVQAASKLKEWKCHVCRFPQADAEKEEEDLTEQVREEREDDDVKEHDTQPSEEEQNELVPEEYSTSEQVGDNTAQNGDIQDSSDE